MNRINRLYAGVKLGIPIAIGYIPIGIAFGVLTTSTGISMRIGIALSSILYAGASQFVGVGMMAAGASVVEIVMTTLILNFRHFIMSSSLSQRMPDAISARFLALLAYGITDETFSVASIQPERILDPFIVLGLNLIAYLAWNFGTILGLVLGDAIPDAIAVSMGIALYAMFVGLLIPGLKNSRPMTRVVIISVVISTIFYYIPPFSSLSSGWRILIATIVASFAGAILLTGEPTDVAKNSDNGNRNDDDNDEKPVTVNGNTDVKIQRGRGNA